jgi:hypothetical protein
MVLNNGDPTLNLICALLSDQGSVLYFGVSHLCFLNAYPVCIAERVGE